MKFSILRNSLTDEKPRAVIEQSVELRKLLLAARNTEFGKHYNFDSILKSKEIYTRFRDSMPINTYYNIKSWWDRARKGESNITWPGQIKYFAMSSGTTNDSNKFIPITREMINSIQKASRKQYAALGSMNLKNKLLFHQTLIVGGTANLHYNNFSYEAYLSGILTSQIPFWVQNTYKPGRKISVLKWDEKVNQIVQNAPDWNIRCVCGVTSWTKVLLEQIIMEHKLETIHDIWPNLKYFVHGGVSLEPYESSLKKLFGLPVQYFETYLASEGFFAIQEASDSIGMRLLSNNGVFFEFVPFDSNNFTPDGEILKGANAISLSEIKVGEEYAVVISTCSGNWRYLLGDVVQFNSVTDFTLKIIGRTTSFLNVCGEHLSGEQMDVAINRISKQFKINISDYCVTSKEFNNQFIHHWYISCDSTVNISELENYLDSTLIDINKNYQNERTIGTILGVKVQPVSSIKFLNFLRLKGKIGEQHKFPRLLQGEKLREWEYYLAT